MKKKPLFRAFTLFGVTLFIELIIVPSLLAKVQAQLGPANQSQMLQSTSRANVTFEPPGTGKPDDTAGGASRGGSCATDVISRGQCVIPLMPGSKEGLTATARPTFFIYVPETAAKEIFFSMVDENNKNHYQTKIPLTGKAGILKFTLPENARPLEIGKNYRWAFIVIGEQGLRPDSPGVQGVIRRIELSETLKSQLQNGTAIERASVYGKNGIWYETLATLGEARKFQPSDANVVANWEQLLNSVGLGSIATKPLLN